MILRQLPENTRGRDFIVSDIHGYFQQLEQALAAQKFDPSADRLIAVGDLVDRGPQSARAWEFLREPWFFSVLGNHEQAMLEWLLMLNAAVAGADDLDGVALREAAARHASFGGDWALPMLTAALRGQLDDARRWQQALSALPLAIVLPRKGKRIGIVHATVPGGDWDQFETELGVLPDTHWQVPKPATRSTLALATIWSRRPLDDVENPEAGVSGIDLVFAGHNTVPSPRRMGNFHMIETAVYAGNALTLVNLDDWPRASAGSTSTSRFRRWLGKS